MMRDGVAGRGQHDLQAGAALDRDRPPDTVGGGVEYKFSPNWSAKVEYLHFDFGRDPSFSINGGTFNFRQDLRLDTVKVGLNYMWGGPVVARY